MGSAAMGDMSLCPCPTSGPRRAEGEASAWLREGQGGVLTHGETAPEAALVPG